MTATELDADEIEHLANHFELGPVIQFRRLDVGTINSNYRIEGGRGAFFLRVNEGKSDDDVRFEIALLDAIAGESVPVARPLGAGSGERMVLHHGKQIVVFPWMAGEHVTGDSIEPAHTAALGVALAELHSASAALVGTLGRTSIYSTPAIAERLARIHVEPGDPELVDAHATLTSELEWLAGQREARCRLEQVIAHHDLFPDNVLFDAHRIVALLDFEQAALGSAHYDLAVCINAWCYRDDAFNGELIGSLLAGYRERRPSTELSAEPLWIECRAAAARFSVTRITDVHLANLPRPGKDYRRYVRRLELWRRSDLAVLEALL